MIYHIQTYCTYGYWPEDLKPKSSRKPIITACDNCGVIRITTKNEYTDLCRKCSQQKRFKRPEEREKNVKAANKRWEDPLEHKIAKERMLKRYEEPLEHEKTSKDVKKAYKDDPTLAERHRESMNEHFSKMDDPGLVIVGHHIAYDFSRPEAFIVWITSRFHGSIHNPKGVQRHKYGYSLID